MEQPPPDPKDWTWVLERPCDQCGYDASSIDRGKLGALIRANAGAWRGVLSRGDIVSKRPPSPPGEGPVWSALEYGAHVRDVYQLFVDRLNSMLIDDDPTFSDWDQDAAAIEGHYHEQDPSTLSYDLAVAAGKLADIVDRVRGDQWMRPGARSDGRAFTVESLIRYVLHDPTHHLWDAEQGYQAIADAEAELED